MTTLELAVVPRDVRAASLGLLLGASSPASLASVKLHEPHGTLTLAVLGASHAVSASAGTRRLTEEVSCDAVAAGGCPLPSRAEEDGYTLRARVRTVDRHELDTLAGSLRALGSRKIRLAVRRLPRRRAGGDRPDRRADAARLAVAHSEYLRYADDSVPRTLMEVGPPGSPCRGRSQTAARRCG